MKLRLAMAAMGQLEIVVVICVGNSAALDRLCTGRSRQRASCT